MQFTTNIRKVGAVTIVDLNGRITLGDGTRVVRETVIDMLKSGQQRILLNLGHVRYIDSAGLGELVRAYTTVVHRGGQIKLLNVQSKVDDLLQVTKLCTVFESFTS